MPSGRFSLLISFFLLSSLVKAQYAEYRYPQEKDEIARLRKFKIRKETVMQSLNGADSISFYSERRFDTMGRVTREVTPYNHRDYSYDVTGRLIFLIDSAKGIDDFYRSDFEFEYDKYGMLSFASIPPYSITFKYDPEKKLLWESTLVDFDSYRKRYYYFDNASRIKEERWIYANELPELRHRITYNHFGKPLQETILKYFENGAFDSIEVLRTYDYKGKLMEQSTITTGHPHPAGYDSLPLLRIVETDTASYKYTYNANGDRSSERFHYSIPGFDHYFEIWYNKMRLPEEKVIYDEKGKVRKRLSYKYSAPPDKTEKQVEKKTRRTGK